jgi:ribosomal-protein-alanine N-acetyltransferase
LALAVNPVRFFHCFLTADADPMNAASVATLTSAGFVKTGEAKNTFCVDGVWSDSVYFTLKPKHWAA